MPRWRGGIAYSLDLGRRALVLVGGKLVPNRVTCRGNHILPYSVSVSPVEYFWIE